jgi:SAM-dependent methyltransferase
MTLELHPRIKAFYEKVDESTRLTASADGALELLRTQELLRPHLPPSPARIVDIGGGPGIHAQWLIGDGHIVHVVDPVNRHVEQARATGATAELGDARALEAQDGTFDAALLLGPLYHLQEETDRAAALAEASRVTQPGGLVAAAAINRYASVFEHAGATTLNRDIVHASVDAILRTARYDGARGFAPSYFHTAEDLEREMTGSGLVNVRVFSIEGPAWGMLKAVEQVTGTSAQGTDLFEAVLKAARLADDHPALAVAGSHLLGLGVTS